MTTIPGDGTGGSSGESPLLARVRAAPVAVGRAYGEQLAVVAELESHEVAGELGYRSTSRLLEDLWRVDPAEAKRLVRHAGLLTPRISLSGEPLAAVLPDTARAVRDGLLSSEHVQVIDTAMGKVRDLPGLPPEDGGGGRAVAGRVCRDALSGGVGSVCPADRGHHRPRRRRPTGSGRARA